MVGLGGGTKVLLACSNANKTRKPQNQGKKNNRQQNNAVITVVTRTKIREKKKRKEQGQGPMFQFLAW